MKKITLLIAFLLSCLTTDAQTLLSENFDTALNWTVAHPTGTSTNAGWTRVTTGGNPAATPFGTGMARFNSYSINVTNAYDLTSPAISFTGGSYRVTFKMYRDNGYLTNAEKIDVYYNTTASSTGGTLLGTVNRSINLAPTVAANGWYDYSFTIPGNPSGSGYISFLATTAYGNNMFIDNVVIENLPACLAPSGLGVNSVTSSGATFIWTPGASETLWNVEYGASGFAQGTGTMVNGVSSASHTVSSLAPNTAYQFYVQSDCGGSGTSTWSGPYSFTTPCVPYSIPYFEGFETGYTHNTLVSGCLSQASVAGTESWMANNTFTDYNRTPRTGAWNAFLRYSNEDWLFIPINLTSGTSYTISFYARQDGAVVANSNIAVSYGTAANAAGMTNSIVAATGIINGNYQQIIGNFIPSATGVYYIGIKGYMNGTPWYISLDDISIDVSPACVPPLFSSLGVNNVTSTGVNLVWSAGATETLWNVQYGPSGFALGSGTMANGVTSPYAISSLSPNTSYEFYVQSDCGGSGTSTWTGPYAFTTACSSVTDFIESFDGVTAPAMPSCWQKVGTTGTAYTQTANSNSAPNTLYVYSSSATNRAVVKLQPVSNLGAGTHRLKMKMRANGTVGGVIEVGYLTNVTDASTFVALGTATAASTTYAQYVVNPAAGVYTDNLAIRHTGVPTNSVLIDDFAWEPIPSTPPVCASNIVATPDASCGNRATNITWDATAEADGYYISMGTTPGGTDILNNVSVPATNYSYTGNTNTTYYFTVSPFNGAGAATGCTEQTFTTAANGCYCPSTPTSNDNSGITNVQIGTTDFPTTDVTYFDHTATTVDLARGINANTQISFATGYTYDTNIWIDFNDNYTFEAGEIVYHGESLVTNPTVLNASYTMPISATLGLHRMRIVATDAVQTPANPCYSGTYGVTLDFSVNIVDGSCTPITLTTDVVEDCNTSFYTVDVNVTDLGTSVDPYITDGTDAWPIYATGVTQAGPWAFGTSVTLSLVHGGDAVCNASLGTFNFTACPPANDSCSTATEITTLPFNASQDASAATNNGGSITTCAGGMNDGVWYTFTVATPGNVTVALTGVTGWDPEVAVYSGSCGVFTCVTSADSGGTGGNETLNMTNLAAGQYWINIGHYSTANTAEGVLTLDVTGTATLGAESFDIASFKAYPNPVKDILNITYSSDITSVEVYNMLGQNVMTKSINATLGQIDMSNLTSGNYILKVTADGMTKSIKVVKQ